MDLLIKSLVGFFVGTLIGMTGVGGGVLLLPILIFGLHVPAMRAVGSEELLDVETKMGASIVHLRKGTVRRKVVLALISGSAPGSYLGVSFLVHLRNVYGNGVNHFITVAVGVLLICIPTFLFFQKKIEERAAVRPPTIKSFAWMWLIGLVAGFLVGITSVGSGSIVMMMLLLFYSFQPKVMVGTDIVHALILPSVTSLLHFPLHNVCMKPTGLSMPFFARLCSAKGKAGFPRRALTIPCACSARAFGWLIRSMAPANSSRVSPSSACRLASSRMAVLWPVESTIQQPTKLFWDRSNLASSTTANRRNPASARVWRAPSSWRAAARLSGVNGKHSRIRFLRFVPWGRWPTS